MALSRRHLLGASLLLPGIAPWFQSWTSGADAAEAGAPWTLVPRLPGRTFSINGEQAAGSGNPGTPISIPPGAREAHILLTYDLPEVMHTAFVEAQVADMGAGINPANVEVPKTYLTWRPGDDRDHWLTVRIHQKVEDGDRFLVYLKAEGFAKGGAVIVEVAQGAVNQLPAEMPKHRAPRRFEPKERPAVELDIAGMEWSDTGFAGNAKSGRPCWRSRLPHGYTQPGNGENGLYANTDAFPAQAIEPVSRDKDPDGRSFLRLHSARFPQPVEFKGAAYPFQAAVVQAQRLDEWCHRRGTFEAEVATPSQLGAWSAFWLIGRTASKQPIWPPEIDCFESFNGAYGARYEPADTSSGQHVGKHGSSKRSNQLTVGYNLEKLGFPPGTNLNRQAHRYACEIGDEWITHFVDGVETVSYRNMTDDAVGRSNWGFFPIINVAVRIDDETEFAEDERSDLKLYGLRYYRG